MTKWEYDLEFIGTDIEEWEDCLNEAGDEGWELVQVSIFGTQSPIALFKRPKE